MVVKWGYKKTDVGIIPEEWEILPLEQVCIPNGLVRGPFGGSLKKEYFVRDGYKVYEQRNAIYHSFELGTYYIDEPKYKELKRFEVRPGDFIISCSGTIGRIYQIPEIAPKGVINQALLKITTDIDVIFDRYFLYLFEWDSFQKKIIDNTQGGAMQNLVGMDIFRQTPILLPTLPEQRSIAAALSDVDALLASLDALIVKKRLIQQGAMQELLTGNRRLPGFGQGAGYRKTEAGIFPDDWELLPLRLVSSMNGRIGWQGLTQAEFTTKDDDPFLITGMNFKDGEIRWDEVYHVSEARYEMAKQIQLRGGDLLMTKDGTIGKMLFVDKIPYPGKASLNSHLLVFRPLQNKYHPKFMFYQLNSEVFRKHVELEKSGSTFFWHHTGSGRQIRCVSSTDKGARIDCGGAYGYGRRYSHL